jgi:hypothetical protein
MKKALLMIAVVACLAACKKDKNPQITSGLFGKWELAYRHGGFSPSVKVSNTGDMYQFNSDSTYVRYVDNKATANGQFSINIYETRDTLKFGLIKFTNPNSTEAWTETPHSVIIGSSIADGPSYEYVKVK